MKVAISEIRANPFQVRKHLDTERVEALAAEIKALGYWGQLRARKHNGHIELCFGHRRLAALKRLKVKEVDLEIVDLSDADMATQALVENLQREGLTDIEKAEGLKRLLGQGNSREFLASMLGVNIDRINVLVKLLELPASSQKLIESGKISGRTATAARQIGGDAMIETAAKHQLPLHTLSQMQTELKTIEEPKIREKVKQAVIAGKVRDPETVREQARKIRASRARDNTPSDLRLVVRGWIQLMDGWTKQLDEVAEFRDYIEDDATLTVKWKTAITALMKQLQRFV